MTDHPPPQEEPMNERQDRLVEYLAAKAGASVAAVGRAEDKIAQRYDAYDKGAAPGCQRIDYLDALDLAATGATLAAEILAVQKYRTAVTIAAEHGPDRVVEWAADELMESSDDTWSGRGNDARRVVADRRREVAAEIIRFVRAAL